MSLDSPLRYPAGITPHGEYHLLRGKLPGMWFHAHDGSIEFRVKGGLAAPFQDPSQAAVSVSNLGGLLAGWQFVTQKGATQHGVTTVANLGDPIEITADIDLIGPNSKATQRLMRDWIAANERMKTGQFVAITQAMGRWWVDARWAKTPPNKLRSALVNRQTIAQTWTVDSSFWQTYPSLDSFRLIYDTASDGFDYTADDLGSDWDVHYTGSGGGQIIANGYEAAWEDDPEDPVLTGGRTTACRRHSFTTSGDNQVIELQIGSTPATGGYFPINTETHILGRVKTTGDVGDDCVRASIHSDRIRLSYFVAGVEHVLRDESMSYPPQVGEVFSLVCGFEDNARLFKVMRGGIPVLSVVESGTGSQLGGSYRGVGFGMHAAAEGVPQRIPAWVYRWSVGDNTSTARSGFVKLINIGDQPMPPRYTCFGPGLFSFANGPGSTDYVQFGPLLPNQVMQVNTDGEQRPVVDMTSVAPTPQAYSQFQRALVDFVNFANAGNVPPLLRQLESSFGIIPPQGHPYSLLSGSFNNPIPAKSPGNPAAPQYISVRIEGGNASSMILAAGTPLTRWPL